MEWYYGLNDQQYGPVSTQDLEGLIKNGTLAPNTLVWREGMEGWQEARKVFTMPDPAADAASTQNSPYSSAPNQPGTYSQTPSGGVIQTGRPALAPGTVPNYLWQSICCVIFCCMPLAIPAIIFASKVNPALMAGDLTEARRVSDEAKKWCWISFGVGLGVNLIYFIVMVGSAAVSG